MESTPSAQMKAKIVAIEEDALIILVPESGDTIRWPISSIPQPFEINDDMSLVLHTGSDGAQQEKATPTGNPGKSAKVSETSETPQNLSDSDKRKLLENLIN